MQSNPKLADRLFAKRERNWLKLNGPSHSVKLNCKKPCEFSKKPAIRTEQIQITCRADGSSCLGKFVLIVVLLENSQPQLCSLNSHYSMGAVQALSNLVVSSGLHFGKRRDRKSGDRAG